MKAFPQLSKRSWILAAFVAACGGSGVLVAQQVLERASASVNRTAPAVIDLGDAVLARLAVPEGFRVGIFASGLGKPRMMDVGSDGTVYVTRRDQGDVLALRDVDLDGRVDEVGTFASSLQGVHGIDVQGGTMYLASSTTVWVTPVAAAAPQALVSGLPEGGQHPNRTVRVGPDGGLYVSVGSSCNNCAEENQVERATLIRYEADGSNRTVLAAGLRNTIGYDWHPATGALWGMDHGSDFRGDDIPPEELNEIVANGHYGWPLCYGERIVDSMSNARPEDVSLEPGQMPGRQPITREAFCGRTLGPALIYEPHAAPMAMQFYRASQFPAEYRNDAFVAMRGSWNRAQPSGYKLVRVRFDQSGRPLAIEDFLTGFLNDDGTETYGRLTGVAVAADGALLVSDDANGVIYRVTWGG